MLGMSMSLALSGSGNRAPLPTLVGYNANATGNPSVATHIAGDIIVAWGYAANNTLVDVPAGFTNWAPDAGSQSGGVTSLRLVYQVASGPGTTIAWGATGIAATSVRGVYVFRNAVRSVNSFVNGTGATCAWPTLALTAPSIVCIMAYKNSAQTAINTAVTPAEGAWNPHSTKNTATATWVGDSATGLTTFAPAARTFDNGTGATQLCAFAMRAA